MLTEFKRYDASGNLLYNGVFVKYDEVEKVVSKLEQKIENLELKITGLYGERESLKARINWDAY
jgi:chaperonin cofactor prefoldin